MLLTRDGGVRLQSKAGDSESAPNGDPAIAVSSGSEDAVSRGQHIDNIGAPDLVAVGDLKIIPFHFSFFHFFIASH